MRVALPFSHNNKKIPALPGQGFYKFITLNADALLALKSTNGWPLHLCYFLILVLSHKKPKSPETDDDINTAIFD